MMIELQTTYATFFAGIGGHLVLAFLVIGGFLISTVMFFWQSRRIIHQLMLVRHLLEDCGSGKQDSQKKNQPMATTKKQLFAVNWTRFKEGMEAPEVNLFSAPWSEFSKHLVLPPPGTLQLVRTTAEPLLYFNERSIYFVNINSRLYDSIPGFLTGGGIFGTFVGLVAGIYLAQNGMSGSPQEMRDAMKFLMGGVSSAFIASVFGIGLSIVFSVMEKRRQYKIIRMLQWFGEELELCLEMATTENSSFTKMQLLQIEQLVELQKITSALKTNQGLGTGATTPDFVSLAPAIGKILETIVKHQEKQTASQQQSLQDFLSFVLGKFQETMSQNMIGVESVIDNIQTQSKELQEGHFREFSQWMQEIKSNPGDEALREVIASLGYAIGNLTEKMDHMHGTQMDLAAQLRDSSTRLAANDGQKAQMQQNASHQESDPLNEAIANAGQIFLGATEKLEETMTGMANFFSNSLNHFSQSNTEMATGLHHANDQVLSRFSETFSTFDTRIDQQRGQLTEDLFRWMQEVKSQFEITGLEALREIITPLGNAIGALTENMARMHNTQTELVAQLSDSSASRAGRTDHSIVHLAAMAESMQAALQEMGALVRDSSMSTNDRQEQNITDLANVASGMRSAQMELAALLRDSSVGFAGSMARTVTDLSAVAENMKSAQEEMVTLLSESAIGFGGQLNQTLADLSQSSTAMVAVQKEMQRFFVATPQFVTETEKLMERFHDGMGEKFALLDQTQTRVQGDNEAMIQSVTQSGIAGQEALREAIVPLTQAIGKLTEKMVRMHGTQTELVAQLSDSSASLAGRTNHSMVHLAAMAESMQAALQEMGALVRDSSVSTNDRQEQTITDLANVASGMRSAQMELAALLRDSSVGFAGSMARTVTDLSAVAENMKSAQEEMVTLLSESAVGFGGQLNQTLMDLSLSSAAMLAGQKEMQNFFSTVPHLVTATEKLLERFQDGMGEKFALLDHAQMRVQDDNEGMIHSLVQFMEQSKSTSRQESDQLSTAMVSAGHLFLSATEKLEETMGGLANFFSNSLDHFSQSNMEMSTGLHHMNDQMLSRFAETFSTLNNHVDQQRVQLTEDLFVWMQEIKSQSEASGQEAVREVVAPLTQAIGDLRGSVVRTQADLAVQLRHAMEAMLQFSNSFGQAQHRFGQMIEAMESSAVMLSMAGEKLQNSVVRIESVTDALSDTQKTARQTLDAILKAYEQLHTMWHDYETRFEQVNTSLERTFVHLKSGLHGFSERVSQFITGVNHMGEITEKMGYVIGGFGTKLDGMSGTMSGFLERMPDAFHQSSRKVVQAGGKIHDNVANFDGLATTDRDDTRNRDNEFLTQFVSEFRDLKNGLHGFSDQMPYLVNGVNNMGNITEKLSYVIDDFGTKLDGINGFLERIPDTLTQSSQQVANTRMANFDGLDTTISMAQGNIKNRDNEGLAQFMSEILEKMPDVLTKSMSIQTMRDTSRQIAQAGEKIHASMVNLDGLASVVSMAYGNTQNQSEQNDTIIGEAYDRMQSAITLIQGHIDSTLASHQIHFNNVNTSMQESMVYIKRHFDRVSAAMQQTMININKDLSVFSSERMCDLIGGVDEHMESVSRQLRDGITNFNGRLDELNNLIARNNK